MFPVQINDDATVKSKLMHNEHPSPFWRNSAAGGAYICTRRFQTRDDSTNNWWVALLTFGEGWHNNHHADPRSVRHGIAWYELDINWLCIRALQRVGLAKNLYLGSTICAPHVPTSEFAPPPSSD